MWGGGGGGGDGRKGKMACGFGNKNCSQEKHPKTLREDYEHADDFKEHGKTCGSKRNDRHNNNDREGLVLGTASR